MYSVIIMVRTKVREGVREMKRMRIKSKIRFTIFIILVILTMSTLVGFATGSNIANSSSYNQFHCVEIESGDTVWDVATAYTPQNMDVRQVVSDILDTNDIAADELIAGEYILVPVYD